MGPEGVPESVWKIAAGIAAQVINGRENAMQEGVADPHRRQGRLAAHRYVLGHPLDEPERELHETPEARPLTPAREVELEGVDDLVPEYVVRVAVRTPQGKDDPVLQPLGDAARALAHRAREDIRLLEVGMIGVEDERARIPDVVLEDPGDPLIPPLGHPGTVLGGDSRFRIEVNIVVWRRQDVEVEGLVLDLVSSEVLGSGTGGESERGDDEQRSKSEYRACHRSSRTLESRVWHGRAGASLPFG